MSCPPTSRENQEVILCMSISFTHCEAINLISRRKPSSEPQTKVLLAHTRNWSSNWLTDWLIDCLIVWLTKWMINWLMVWITKAKVLQFYTKTWENLLQEGETFQRVMLNYEYRYPCLPKWPITDNDNRVPIKVKCLATHMRNVNTMRTRRDICLWFVLQSKVATRRDSLQGR